MPIQITSHAVHVSGISHPLCQLMLLLALSGGETALLDVVFKNEASCSRRIPYTLISYALLCQVMLLSALSGAEMALLDVGINITPGAGVGAAITHLQSTSASIRGRELV